MFALAKGLLKVHADHDPTTLRAEAHSVRYPNNFDQAAVCHLCYCDHCVLLAVHVLIIARINQRVNQKGVVFLQLYCPTEYDFLPGKGLYFPGLIKVGMVHLVELALPQPALGCGLELSLGKLRHVSQLVCQCDS